MFGDILVVTTWECYWNVGVEVRDAAKLPKAAPTAKTYPAPNIIMAKVEKAHVRAVCDSFSL